MLWRSGAGQRWTTGVGGGGEGAGGVHRQLHVFVSQSGPGCPLPLPFSPPPPFKRSPFISMYYWELNPECYSYRMFMLW